FGAERSQSGNCVRQSRESQRTGSLLAIELAGLGGIKAAGNGVLGVVEPQTHMERMGRLEIYIGVEAEVLIQQNRLQTDMTIGGALNSGYSRLRPRHVEAGGRLNQLALGVEDAALGGKDAES